MFSIEEIEEKIKSIEFPIENNPTLLISENKNKVLLPYTLDELEEYERDNPKDYPNRENVVKKQYIIPLDSLYKNKALARFTQTYSLLRLREGENFFIALIYAIIFITKIKLDPAIIAACKNKDELLEYMKCLNENKLERFKAFEIIYDDLLISRNQILIPLSQKYRR